MTQARIIAAAVLSALGGAGAAHAQSESYALPAGGAYDFAYRIAGDRRIAPVQVFDDGRQTYMQFRAGQSAPAIFSGGPRGETLAAVTWRGGYAVLPGTAQAFTLRLGEAAAQAVYHGRAPRSGVAGLDTPDAFDGAGADGPVAAAMPMDGMRAGRPLPVHPAAGAAALAPAPARGPVFDATPADHTMRQALARWAGMAGWTFDTEHWTAPVDIPLAGAATLGREFKPAVRELLASTELSAHPLQPCFYSNKVLRVIPLAESCNRAAAPTGGQG